MQNQSFARKYIFYVSVTIYIGNQNIFLIYHELFYSSLLISISPPGWVSAATIFKVFQRILSYIDYAKVLNMHYVSF